MSFIGDFKTMREAQQHDEITQLCEKCLAASNAAFNELRECNNLREQVRDRNDMIANVERENDALREQVAAYQERGGRMLGDMDRLLEENAKLRATIESVRRRIHWKPPTHGMHTNGPCYIFHGEYERIIEDILDGHPFEESDESHG